MKTHYAPCGELTIAWQAIGDGPIDLLVIPGLVSHVEAFHELPGYTRLLEELARFARVITFDKRGNGLSDRVADVPSLPERIDDVHAVLAAAGSKRTALLGISEGSALAIHFAATEPNKVSALALFGAFPRMLAAPGYEPGFPPAAYDQFTSQMVAAWGTGHPLLAMFGPSMGTSDAIREVAAKVERLSATPTTLRGLWRMNASIDVRDNLGQISAPLLIMHRVEDRVVPIATARWLAAHLPQARYVELAGEDHFPFAGDQSPIIDAMSSLLGAPARTSATAPTVAAPLTVDSQPPTNARPLPSGLVDRLAAGSPVEAPLELGRFRVLRLLGAGGMGSVYLAEDLDLGRQVALKVLHGSDAGAYRRFRREAMAVAQLSHPAVVQVYELGLDAATPYLVMEYVRGGTVQELAALPLPWRRAAALCASAAAGLGAAHAVGIVHRDVKPANLLLPDRAGTVAKIADFGVAKLAGAEALTREGAVIGTIGYLSPEQARGDAVDARSDVFALGATLYRLLTGERHVDGTAAEILAQTLLSPIPDPRQRVPDIPAALAELVCRMGSLEAGERPPDGAAVAVELERIAG